MTITDATISCAPGVPAYIPGHPSAVESTLLLGTASPVQSSIAAAAGHRLAKHAQKRFAMAGTDANTNVWPLSPQKWMSG
jgi:hypothetical protein